MSHDSLTLWPAMNIYWLCIINLTRPNLRMLGPTWHWIVFLLDLFTMWRIEFISKWHFRNTLRELYYDPYLRPCIHFLPIQNLNKSDRVVASAPSSAWLMKNYPDQIVSTSRLMCSACLAVSPCTPDKTGPDTNNPVHKTKTTCYKSLSFLIVWLEAPISLYRIAQTSSKEEWISFVYHTQHPWICGDCRVFVCWGFLSFFLSVYSLFLWIEDFLWFNTFPYKSFVSRTKNIISKYFLQKHSEMSGVRRREWPGKYLVTSLAF